MSENKVWFITGCSTGFGRELAKHLLENNYRVVVTARDVSKIQDLVAINKENALPIALDVTKKEQVTEAVAQAESHFGRIDVLVNNAGFGYFGAIEESDEAEVRSMFETNFWGLAEMTRAALPKMRERRSGTIVNISSIGGFVGFPGVGYYNATKFAVGGFSEALKKEVEPLGIKVVLVEPSGFRTDWAGRSANDAEKSISDYAETAGANQAAIRGYSGNQPGDPVRAAKAIIEAVESAQPPFYLLLGKAALKNARIKLDELKTDFDAWAEVTEGADFPEAEAAPVR
ncbi:MAG TPA: oxidoreductase [Pyrinomonadaceae bacterium]|jgi:NAD(P)-dependent dehydrogenase (short-subunit alcohol dehydrogenase family)|nr:oxidoreductase [Pyrinomonadaceae bacterium]